MGCGPSSQICLYHKDEMPECINLTFNYNKNQKDNNLIKQFDDNETFLKKSRLFHIEKFTVFVNKFISGIAITYKIDGANKRIVHMGNASGNDIKSVNLEEFEHIDKLQCTYSQEGLHSIHLSTNAG
jgi:hypothetical protein